MKLKVKEREKRERWVGREGGKKKRKESDKAYKKYNQYSPPKH